MPAVGWWILNLRWVDVLAAFKCKAAFFISGLIMNYCIVEYAVGGILVSYLTDKWENNDTVKAYVIMSAKEGITSVLQIVVAHITDAYLGRFVMISICTACYVIGLCLLWLVDPADNMALFMVVVGLTSFGEAGQENPLKAFLADQLRKNCPDELNVEVRTRFWWRIMRFIGALIAILALERLSWNSTFRICVVMMSLALLLFVFGFPNYYYEKPTGSPLITIFRVLVAAISNRHLQRSNDPTDYYKNNIDDKLPLIPDILYFRWLDKAALIATTLPTVAQEQVKNRKQCSVTQVKEVKGIIAMFPMWATFLVYCLTHATGSSFFFNQSSNLEDHILNKVPLVSLYVFQKVSTYGIKALCELIITHKWSVAQRFSAVKVRIGLGMFCSFLCCVAARLVELQRLDKVTKDDQYRNSDDKTINMSIFWLAPQFCLLGLMEGLAEEGLEEFFDYQVTDSLKRYDEPFNQLALGIGKFISILSVLIFRHWFGETINYSRLDNYYGILAVMSLGNLAVVYPFVSTNFYNEPNYSQSFTHSSPQTFTTSLIKEEDDLNMNQALHDLTLVRNQLRL